MWLRLIMMSLRLIYLSHMTGYHSLKGWTAPYGTYITYHLSIDLNICIPHVFLSYIKQMLQWTLEIEYFLSSEFQLFWICLEVRLLDYMARVPVSPDPLKCVSWFLKKTVIPRSRRWHFYCGFFLIFLLVRESLNSVPCTWWPVRYLTRDNVYSDLLSLLNIRFFVLGLFSIMFLCILHFNHISDRWSKIDIFSHFKGRLKIV